MNGQRLVIGRSAEQVKGLVAALQRLDPQLRIQCIPLITTLPLDVPLPEPDTYDTLLFTSQNAVRFFLEKGGKVEGKRLLAIGEATARALPAPCHFISGAGHADGMADELLSLVDDLRDCRILYPTSALSERLLEKRLAPVVASFLTLPIYTSAPHPALSTADLSADYALYYSPSGVSAWAKKNADRPTAISIGPSTTSRLKKLGWTHIIEANAPTEEALYKTLKEQLISCTQKSE